MYHNEDMCITYRTCLSRRGHVYHIQDVYQIENTCITCTDFRRPVHMDDVLEPRTDSKAYLQSVLYPHRARQPDQARRS